MHRDSVTARRILPLLALIVTASLAAQTPAVPGSWRPVNPFLEEEAPPFLLDLDVGDTEVELFVLGSWIATSQVATSVAFHPPLPDSGRRVTWGYPYPDFETQLFDQTVDLTVSLWLYERYFFEASFADDSDVNSIAAGYYARDDELVREFIIGNVPLAVSRYPYQYTGSTGARTGRTPNPGTVLRLGTDRTFHEFLLQLENSQQERIRVSGGRILEEAIIRPEDYLRGRAFVLPDAAISAVELLIQDENGDLLGTLPGDPRVRRFRTLDAAAGEYVVDTSTGTVRLGESVPENRAIAVYYESGGAAVGAAANGTDALVALDDAGGNGPLSPTTGFRDFSFTTNDLFGLTGSNAAADYNGADFRVALNDGRDALLIRAPGLWSPFESAHLYQLPDDADDTTRFRIVRRGTRTAADTEIELRRIPNTQILVAQQSGATPRELGGRYPWAEVPPRELHARMYGPRSTPATQLAESEIFIEYGRSTDEIVLPGDVVPGSVAVTSGGRSVAGATVRYETGTVELPPGASNAAAVDISYRVYGEDGGSSDLVMINGNRWQPTDNLNLSLATGLRWTLTDNSYSTELNQHPGQITVSSGAEWINDAETLRIDVAGAAQVSQSDTTGYMRLFGSQAEDATLTPAAETVFPSRAAPGLGTRSSDYSEGTGDPDLTDAQRVLPRYRDYWTTDALGNASLTTYPDLPDADTDRSGARIGPYIARSSDAEYTGTVAVLEWDALPDGTWTGARISRDGDDIDLRDAQSVLVTYRYIDDGGSSTAPKLLFEVGTLGEDLDGDGTLDRGRSAVDPTLEFNSAAGLRRAGQDAPGLTAPHSEDTNRNGVSDPEPESGVYSYLLTGDDPGDVADADKGWRTIEVDLTPLERSRLTAVRGARIVAAASGGDVAAGRIVIGEIAFRRTRSATVIDPGDDYSAQVAIVPDPLTGAASLREKRSVVENRFAPDATDQRVVELRWGGGAGTVATEFPIPDFSTRAYGTLRSFMYIDAATTGAADETVTLTLAPYRDAPSDESVTVAIPADRLTGGWHDVVLSFNDEEVTVDGSRIPGGASVGRNVERDLLTVAHVTVEGIKSGGIGAGSLFFDELHAADPQTSFAVAGRIGAEWNYTITDGALEGTEFYVAQSIAAQGEDFQAAGSAVTEDGTASTAESATAGAGAVATDSRAGVRSGAVLLEGEVISRDSAGGTEAAFGHTVQLPLAPQQLVVARESFFRDYRFTSPGFQRSLGLNVGNVTVGRYQVESHQSIAPADAEQSWNLDIAPPPIGFFGLTLRSDAALYAPRLAVETESYGDSWVRSNAYIAPIPERLSPQERDHTTAVDTTWGPLEIGGDLGWKNRSSLSGDQVHRIGLDTALPLDFAPEGRRPWRFTPSYLRRYTFTETVDTRNFGDDGDAWGAHIADEPIIFSAPPVAELFAQDGPGTLDELGPDALGRTYESEGRLRFSRAFSSRVSDLYVPSDVEALVRRNLSWEADSVADTRRWQMTITAIAVNLFGREGSRPRFGIYRSDEFRNAVILGLEERPGSDRKPQWSIGLEQETSLFGAGENRFDLLSTLDLSGGETSETVFGSQIGYVWDRFKYPQIGVFERMENKPFYRHEETLAVEVTATDGTYTGSEVTLGHVTRLVITEQGSIAAFGDLGWIADPGEYENGALHLVGLRIGIEGRLSY